MGVSSVIKYTHHFCDILCGIRKDFIRIPNIKELSPIIRKFGEESKIPNVVAAIDGSHMPIKAPLQNKEDYFNRKHRYSILLQGVVGPQFFDVFVGVPGSVHDSRLLRLSKFGREMESGLLFQVPRFNLDGVEIKPIVLGDSAYALKTWLIPPYKRMERTRRKGIRPFKG